MILFYRKQEEVKTYFGIASELREVTKENIEDKTKSEETEQGSHKE